LHIQALSGAFRGLENQGKKIILMIDEAGHLAPGLINALIDYAVKNPVLRVLFVLTHDELDLKNSSDNGLDDCHLIEIPPLSEQQCGVFLQHLAVKPRSPVAVNEINDAMIAAVYLETQGIPGLIIAQLPASNEARQAHHPLGILVAAVVGLIALALGTQWFSGSDYNLKRMSDLAISKSTGIENATPPALPETGTLLKKVTGVFKHSTI
jgi:DamX protein